MICFVRFAVLQIGRSELRLGFDEVVDAGAPERFQIQQMADLFLNGPLFFAPSNQTLPRDAAQHFLYAGGCAAKPDTEIGIEAGGKIKFEFAFKPLAGVAHERILTGAAA